MGNLMDVKKGDKVALFGFTGISFGLKTVEAADKKTITFTGRAGEMIFDKKTGIQTNNAKGDRWANKIYPADELEQHLTGKQAPAAKSKTAKKDEKKPSAKVKAAPVEDDEDEDEAPVKKPAAKAEKKAAPAPAKATKKDEKKPAAKKAAKPAVEVEDDDDGEYEEA